MARCFYNWTFIPYAMYALSGVIIAYMYYNRHEELSVSASPNTFIRGKGDKGVFKSVVDTLSVLAIGLGLAASLGAGLALCWIWPYRRLWYQSGSFCLDHPDGYYYGDVHNCFGSWH